VTPIWPWVTLAALGVYHGLNPAMGWLFAVALGLQRRALSAVLIALVPIAIGHALSIAVVVTAIAALRNLVPIRALRIGGAVTLVAFGLYRLLARHRARVGMQVSNADLVAWSFLMATAHGAGLMLLAVLLAAPLAMPGHEHVHLAVPSGAHDSALVAAAALAVHTAAMLFTAGIVAVVVYQWAGLAFLRRGWINLDLLWVVTLIGAGVVLLALAL
jgi:hypothetical protein